MRHLLAGVGKDRFMLLRNGKPNSDPRHLEHEIVPELKPQTSDIVIYKHRFSGFLSNRLGCDLKQLESKYLNRHWMYTAYAWSRPSERHVQRLCVCVASSCTGRVVGSSLPRSNHEASLFLIQQRFGWVSASGEFIKPSKHKLLLRRIRTRHFDKN